MTKSELKTGYIVTLRNGNEYVVMLNANFVASYEKDFLVREHSFIHLAEYNEDLTHFGESDRYRNFDIIKVGRFHFVDNVFDYKDCVVSPIWERNEVKKMTVAEIESILGYKVEIVSDK